MNNHDFQAGKSIEDFKFNKKRVRILTESSDEVKPDSKGILYWMFRDARVEGKFGK